MIEQAKAEWRKKTSPQEFKPQQPSGGGMQSPRMPFPICYSIAVYSELGSEYYDQKLTTTAVITDFEDPKFDLEAYLKMKEAQEN